MFIGNGIYILDVKKRRISSKINEFYKIQYTINIIEEEMKISVFSLCSIKW